MAGQFVSRSLRVLSSAALLAAVSTSNAWADPIVVTSGQLEFGRGPAFDAFLKISGLDGFSLGAAVVPINVALGCSTGGCHPGDVVNLSLVGGAGSGHRPPDFRHLPDAFTLGTAAGAVVNGTVFGQPGNFQSFAGAVGLAGSLRFDVPPIVLPSSLVDVDHFGAPFVFNGHITGFSIDDVNARTPLFDLILTGRGRAFVDFESGLENGIFRESVLHYNFESAAAATPEPASLALLGSGLIGIAVSLRTRRRRA
jgi:hypothetical protein